MKTKWFFLLVFTMFVAKCYYTGISTHEEKWFSTFYDTPSAPELIWEGFWKIAKTTENFNWSSIGKMWDIYNKLSENDFL